MRVCMIVGAYPPMKCGVGDYTEKLCEAMGKLNIKIDIITSNKSIEDKDTNNENVCVHRIIEKWDFTSYKKVNKIIQQVKPDLLHIQYPSDEYGKSLFINLIPVIIKIKYGIKIVETVHECMHYTFKGKLRNLINYKVSDAIIIVEKRYENIIKNFISFISKKFNTIYIPISSNISKSRLNKEELLNIKFNYIDNSNESLISYFGFINELKGFDTLIESLYKIKSSSIKFKLLAIAELNPDKNQYHKYIDDLIKKYNLSNDIIFTGFIKSDEKVSDLISASDVCVFPFKEGVSERNGSFLAALTQGNAIVTTSFDKSGYDKDKNVYYIKPNDPQSLSKLLIDIIDFKKIEKKKTTILSWNDISLRTINIYKKLLNEKK